MPRPAAAGDSRSEAKPPSSPASTHSCSPSVLPEPAASAASLGNGAEDTVRALRGGCPGAHSPPTREVAAALPPGTRGLTSASASRPSPQLSVLAAPSRFYKLQRQAKRAWWTVNRLRPPASPPRPPSPQPRQGQGRGAGLGSTDDTTSTAGAPHVGAVLTHSQVAWTATKTAHEYSQERQPSLFLGFPVQP